MPRSTPSARLSASPPVPRGLSPCPFTLALEGQGGARALPGFAPAGECANFCAVKPLNDINGRAHLPAAGEIWSDPRQANRIPVTAIAAVRPAYSELVRMLPGSAPLLSVGDTSVIAGRRGSAGIAPSEIERWSPGQVDALLRNFRGT